MRLKVAHSSMEFSDTPKQQKHDANIIFARNYAWITGTEAGMEPLTSLLRDAAELNGYTFGMYKANWVAVRKDLIDRGSYKFDKETVVDNDLVVGAGHDTNIVWAQFTNPALGKVTVMASHYPRFGRPGASDPTLRVNLKWTEKLAHAIGDNAEEFGAGKALVFYGGDQNIPDNISDTFFGEPMTSTWDELGRYENTGHGIIDVIASYDRDTRVKAVSSRALSDKELALFTDHFLVEAVFDVQNLPVKP